MPLDLKDAGSAALDNPEALAQMRDIWQANVQKMAQLVHKRGWMLTDKPPTTPVGLSTQQLNKLETTVGEPLPQQLRWLLSWAKKWQFGWRFNEEKVVPPGEFAECNYACLEWNTAALLVKEDLRGQLSY